MLYVNTCKIDNLLRDLYDIMICLASTACVAKTMCKQRLFCFDILLTVISQYIYLNINQHDALNFIMSLIHNMIMVSNTQ